ncbi:MAG: translation initiation factor IF-2, partial [Flavitalea sp.]
MAETTTPRLMAAAKEFNVGKDTLVDYLLGKGFDKEDLKPTSKLSEEMYRALQQEFQGDKVAKLKSDAIDLPKGQQEQKKKKEDEAVVFKKDSKKTEEEKPKEEPVVVEKTPEPVIEPVAEPVVERTPEPEVVETPQVQPTVESTPTPPVEEIKTEETASEITRVGTPELEGPKVLDKIDLSAIDSSTRPRKPIIKRGDDQAQAAEQPVQKQAEKAPVSVAPEKIDEVASEPVLPQGVETTPETTDADAPPVITNIRAEKLEGPKIL